MEKPEPIPFKITNLVAMHKKMSGKTAAEFTQFQLGFNLALLQVVKMANVELESAQEVLKICFLVSEWSKMPAEVKTG